MSVITGANLHANVLTNVTVRRCMLLKMTLLGKQSINIDDTSNGRQFVCPIKCECG